MSTLIGTCPPGKKPKITENLQLPLLLEPVTNNMVVQLPRNLLPYHEQSSSSKDKSEKRLLKPKIKMLNVVELKDIFSVSSLEVNNLATKNIACIGCRKGIENLMTQLQDSGHQALVPLVINKQSNITVKVEQFDDINVLSSILQRNGQSVYYLIDSIPKSRKNKRCLLHCMDSQRIKPSSWMEVWNIMNDGCRDMILTLKFSIFRETLDSYLKKHRFCTDCKSMVMRAQELLFDGPKEDDKSEDAEDFKPDLYDGITSDPETKLLQVISDTTFINSLIERAEPELRGSRRERHAKTLDIAQEEVLTCLGVCIYDRLSHVWQKLRELEQTWKLLTHLVQHGMRNKYELLMESKQGYSQLELVCEEISREETAKQLSKAQKKLKKQKKKKRKNANKENKARNSDCQSDEDEDEGTSESEESKVGQLHGTKCEEVAEAQEMQQVKSRRKRGQRTCQCSVCDQNHAESTPCANLKSSRERNRCKCLKVNGNHPVKHRGTGCLTDCGYSSATSSELCSSNSSSCDGSEVACTEGYCNHDDLTVCERECPVVSHNHNHHQDQNLPPEPTTNHNGNGTHQNRKYGLISKAYNGGPSLQDMLLRESNNSDEDLAQDDEMIRLKAQLPQLKLQRQQLRQKLRDQFVTFQSRQFPYQP